MFAAPFAAPSVALPLLSFALLGLGLQDGVIEEAPDKPAAVPPEIAADSAALTDGEPAAADAAFRRLKARADDWRDVRTQDDSLPAARALRTVAQGGGPYAERAAEALRTRHAAVWAELERGGVRVERRFVVGGTYFDEDVLRLPGVTRRMTVDQPAPPGEPHPALRLRLLNWSGGNGAAGSWPINLYLSVDQRRAKLTDDHFEQLCSVPALRSLALSRLEGLPAAWRETLRAHPTLAGLSVERCGITAADCAAFASIPNLQRVDLFRNAVGDEGVRALAARPTLRSLDLRLTGVTDAGLKALAGLTVVDDIRLSDAGVTDAGFAALPLRNIKLLSLNGTRCGDGALKHMIGRWANPADPADPAAAAAAAAAGAVSVPFSGPPPVSEDGVTILLGNTPVTDAGLAHLAAVPRVGWLSIGHTAVTGTGFDAWAAAGTPLPRRVEADGGAFDDAGCLALSRCPCPRDLTLRLMDTRVTAAGVRRLRTMENLTDFNFGGPQMNDELLAAVAGFVDPDRMLIRHGTATGTGFGAFGGKVPKVIWFQNGKLTDEGVRAIVSRPGLERLVAETLRDGTHAGLTDAVWRPLATVPTLRRVDFEDAPVAGPGLANLAAHEGPREPDGGQDRVTLAEALLRFGWGGQETGGPRDWAAALWERHGATLPAALCADLTAAPLATVPLRLATVPRLVDRPPGPVMEVALNDVGLTDELLRSLPRLPVKTWFLRQDPITEAAVMDFLRRQPDVTYLAVGQCPAERNGGQRRINDFLAARRARRTERPGNDRPNAAAAGPSFELPAWADRLRAQVVAQTALRARAAELNLPGTTEAEWLAAAAARAADPAADPGAAGAAVALLQEIADDWQDPADRERSVRAATALQSVADGNGPARGRPGSPSAGVAIGSSTKCRGTGGRTTRRPCPHAAPDGP